MLVGSVTHPDEIGPVSQLVDLIELRFDAYPFTEMPKLPWILTLRRQVHISEEKRLSQIEKALQLGPAYCDLETDTDPIFIARMAKKFPRVKFIGSYHNFETMPDLDDLLQSMKNPHFAIYKIAVTPHSTPEMLRLMLFAKKAKVPLSVMGMGPFGRPSRILAPIMGSVLNYAGLQEDLQLHRDSLQTLIEIYRFRQLNTQTLIYALIGDPIEQSPGHLFHNSHFKHNAVYVKLQLRPSELPSFLELMQQLPFGGLSVTMPLKEAIVPYLSETTPIGAVNTVVRNKGVNTDGPGALNAIEKHTNVRGKRLAILGAGGTARAIAHEALKRGAMVSIYNRTIERAYQLAAEFGCTGHGLDELKDYDILVNTIPTQIIREILSAAIVMDVIYAPKETPLLQAAKRAGCVCIYGEEMFIEQALLQQDFFFCQK
jgi:3-dehydroquinate dehydratase/shikimate dehydrogenase